MTACIQPAKRARLLEQLEKKLAQLALMENAYEEGMTPVEEYSLNTGEGTQRTKYRSLEELAKEIDRLESQIDNIRRRLCGGGIVNINVRRKHYNRGFGYGRIRGY